MRIWVDTMSISYILLRNTVYNYKQNCKSSIFVLK